MTSEERLNDRLEKLGKHTHRISDISKYLVTLKYGKARDHSDEVKDFKEVLESVPRKSSPFSMTVMLLLQQLQPLFKLPLFLVLLLNLPLPSSSLKSSLTTLLPLLSWKKQFRAYFDSAQLGALPCSQQQAYLCNCLDTVLRARIDQEATGTTPVYSPIVGLFMCIAILDNTFLEAYPIHIRRKHFFDARQ